MGLLVAAIGALHDSKVELTLRLLRKYRNFQSSMLYAIEHRFSTFCGHLSLLLALPVSAFQFLLSSFCFLVSDFSFLISHFYFLLPPNVIPNGFFLLFLISWQSRAN
jgi:hypothetical protein